MTSPTHLVFECFVCHTIVEIPDPHDQVDHFIDAHREDWLRGRFSVTTLDEDL